MLNDKIDKQHILEAIGQCGLLPAVRVSSVEEALRSSQALLDGGIRVAEIAMSMSQGLRALEEAVAEFGNSMLFGAGTVLDAETARKCIRVGAQYLVTPMVALDVIEVANNSGVPVFCGALTPTEMLAAWSAGADCIKVFPIDSFGGVGYIRAIRAPLPHLRLLPMGGVTLQNAADFIRSGSFAIGVGSDLVSSSRLTKTGTESIASRATAYVAEIQKARTLNT